MHEDREVCRAAYSATRFQGGLHWYRCGASGIGLAEMQLFAGPHVAACRWLPDEDLEVYRAAYAATGLN